MIKRLSTIATINMIGFTFFIMPYFHFAMLKVVVINASAF